MDILTSRQFQCGRSNRPRTGVKYCLQIMLLYATALTVINSGEVPHFTLQPQSAVVKESSKVSLRCKVSPEGSTILWLYRGKNVTSNSDTGIDVEDGRLVIRSFRRSSSRQPSDEGVYHCLASNSEGTTISLGASLEPAYMGDFYEGPQDHHINVTEGNVAYIPCAPISGRPRPHVHFELNGTTLDTTPERYMVLPSGTLQISNVRSRDRGLYRCLAYNDVSDESKRAKRIVDLNVIPPISNHPPVFNLVPPREVKVIRGHNLTLECVVEGAPVPVVNWSKYGGKLPENRYRLVFGNLELFDVGRLDEGTYICNAHNGIGPRQVAISQVDVLEPATIQTGPADQRVTMGTSASFQCQGRGKPAVKVEWYHNGQILKSGSGIISINDTMLIVNQVRPRHEGVYQCIIKNSLGGVTASARLSIADDDEAELRTKVVDQMQGIAPDMERTDDSETSGEQNRHKNNPTPGGALGRTPSPTERHEGRRRGNNNDPDDDVLEISDDGDQANDGGRRKSNRHRGRKPAPNTPGDGATDDQSNGDLIPPSKPAVTKLSDTSVMLEWNVPDKGGLTITFFKVQYKELVADKPRRRWRTIDVDIQAHVRRFEVTALKPGCTYRFRIVGVYSNNDNQHGPNSRKFTMETPAVSRPKVPLMGPVIVEARPLSQNAISLKWQYLPEKWTPLEGFTIYYHIYGSHGNPQKLTVVGSNIRETELEPLLANTMYAIRMKGYNMGGESEFSNTVVQSTISSSSHGEMDYDMYPGFNGDFHINGKPMPTNWPGLVPGTYKPSTEGAPDDVNRKMSTEESSRMLYIVLGCVLGIMVLFLLFFMTMCAWKQRQRTLMLATLESRNKFEDPSRAIYTHDSIRHKQMNGNGLLLNGLTTSNGNGTIANGHVSTGYSSNHMNITANPMTETDGQRSPTGHHHDNRDSITDNVQSLHELRASLQEMLQVPPPPPPLATGYDEDRPHHPESDNMDRYEANMSTFGRNRSRYSHQMAPADHLYDQPPEYHSIGSRRSQVPDHRPSPQLSMRSQTSSSYRVHDPHLTDHIPRSHDHKHYRRPDTCGGAVVQGEADHSSEHSHSSSSQVSAKHKRRRRKPIQHDDYMTKDQSTNTDNENTLPNDSQVNHRLPVSPSDHQHHRSNQSPHHSNQSPRHSNQSPHHSHQPHMSHHHGNNHHYDANADDEPQHGNQLGYRDDPSDHDRVGYHDDTSDHDGEQLVDNGEVSSDDRDYEIITDSSPPPSYQSPPSSRVHGDAHHLHGNPQYSDEEALPEAPPTPPQIPRMHDYPQSDPDD